MPTSGPEQSGRVRSACTESVAVFTASKQALARLGTNRKDGPGDEAHLRDNARCGRHCGSGGRKGRHSKAFLDAEHVAPGERTELAFTNARSSHLNAGPVFWAMDGTGFSGLWTKGAELTHANLARNAELAARPMLNAGPR